MGHRYCLLPRLKAQNTPGSVSKVGLEWAKPRQLTASSLWLSKALCSLNTESRFLPASLTLQCLFQTQSARGSYTCPFTLSAAWSDNLVKKTSDTNDRIFFVFVCFARLCSMCDLSFPTRDWTRIPCTGSTESSPLDHQGSLIDGNFLKQENNIYTC